MHQPRERDRIQCLECGKWYRALPSHLLRAHGMPDEDYRLKFEIPVGVPLVCEEWSETQSKHAIDRGSKRHLNAHSQVKGFKQRESVRQRRKSDYARLLRRGNTAAAALDKTMKRRELLRPYPVTVSQAAERLGCTVKAAYVFLSYCLTTGRLRRISRGLYGDMIDENHD